METGWRKSSRSSSQGNGDCVEARKCEGVYQVRDSKLGEDSPVFSFAVGDLAGLLRAAQR